MIYELEGKQYDVPEGTGLDELESFINSQKQNVPSSFDSIKSAEEYVSGVNRSPFDTARDLAYGSLVGLGKGGQFIAQSGGGEGAPLPQNAGFGTGQTPISLNQLQAAQPKSNMPSINFEEYLAPIASPNRSISGETIKELSQTLPYLPMGGASIPGQIAASTVASGLTANPEQENLFDQLPKGRKGAMFENLLLSTLGLGAAKVIPKAVNAFRPGKAAEEMKATLGNVSPEKQIVDTEKGLDFKTSELPNLRENSASLSQDIKSGYDAHSAVVKGKMEPVTQKYGETLDIYPLKNPSGIHAYRELPTFKLKGLKNKEVYSSFKSNPNLTNSHELQKAVGEKIGELKKNPYSHENQKQLDNFNYAYKELNSKIDSRLKEVDPQAADQWKEGREYHRINVLPYRINSKIRNIVEGKTTNPKNIHQPFEYPGEQFDKKTKKYIKDNADKIVSDLPAESKNKILFSKIKGSTSNKTPEKLANNLLKAKNEGFDTYFTPELNNKITSMTEKSRNLNALKTVSGVELVKRILGSK